MGTLLDYLLDMKQQELVRLDPSHIRFSLTPELYYTLMQDFRLENNYDRLQEYPYVGPFGGLTMQVGPLLIRVAHGFGYMESYCGANNYYVTLLDWKP